MCSTSKCSTSILGLLGLKPNKPITILGLLGLKPSKPITILGLRYIYYIRPKIYTNIPPSNTRW